MKTRNIFNFFFLFFIIFVSLNGWSGRPKTAIQIKNLKLVFNKMWLVDAVKFDVKKIVKSSFIDKDKVYEGELFFSKGLLRLKFIKPIQSEVVIDEKFIWHAQKLPKDFGGWQVMRIKKSLTKSSQALLNLMFGDQLLWEKLEVIGVSKKNGFEAYVFRPKKKSDFPGIAKIAIMFRSENKNLVRIRQWDDLENEVTYNFSNQDFSKVIDKKFFKYRPPKGVEVSYFN